MRRNFFRLVLGLSLVSLTAYGDESPGELNSGVTDFLQDTWERLSPKAPVSNPDFDPLKGSTIGEACRFRDLSMPRTAQHTVETSIRYHCRNIHTMLYCAANYRKGEVPSDPRTEEEIKQVAIRMVCEDRPWDQNFVGNPHYHVGQDTRAIMSELGGSPADTVSEFQNLVNVLNDLAGR